MGCIGLTNRRHGLDPAVIRGSLGGQEIQQHFGAWFNWTRLDADYVFYDIICNMTVTEGQENTAFDGKGGILYFGLGFETGRLCVFFLFFFLVVLFFPLHPPGRAG